MVSQLINPSTVGLSDDLKAARAKLGLSQSQAAKAWGVALSSLQDWEQGQHQPRGIGLKAIQEIVARINTEEASPSAPPVATSTKRPPSTPG